MSFFSCVFIRLRAWKRINTLFTGLGLVRIVKNCHLGLENDALGGQHFQDLGHSFSLYGPPSQQITYIYVFSARIWRFDMARNYPANYTGKTLSEDKKLELLIVKFSTQIQDGFRQEPESVSSYHGWRGGHGCLKALEMSVSVAYVFHGSK